MGAASSIILKAIVVLSAFAIALPAAAAPEKPETFDVRSFTCPLGGEQFSQDVGYSAYPLLTLPDGSWLGDFAIGAQVPVCPGNGLVLIPKYDLYVADGDPGAKFAYPGYSPAELARLPALIARDEYKQLKHDGPYLQAWWLATKLGRPAYGRFNLLQRATWATRDPAQRRRLVERFVAESPALIDAADAPTSAKLFMRKYVVNGYRELGRFGEAQALLVSLYQGLHDQPGAAEAGVEPIEASPMARAIAERDDGWFAAETIDRKMFGGLCSGELSHLYGPLKPATKAACTVRKDREAREEREDELAFAEAARSQQDAAALDAKCAQVSVAKRSKGLGFACDALSFKQDGLAGDTLAQDGAALAKACEATPADKRNGALLRGCSSYTIASTGALEVALADDPEAFAILCPPSEAEVFEDEAEWVALACSGAARALGERAMDKLLLDTPALDARCAVLGRNDYSDQALNGACFKRKLNLESELEEKLASDPVAFAATCGKLKLDTRVDFESPQADTIMRCRDAQRRRDLRNIEAEERAKGLECFGEPEDRVCSTPDERAAGEARREASKDVDSLGPQPGGPSEFDDNSSLSQAARKRAAAVIAQAKRDKTYPKRQPGDEF